MKLDLELLAPYSPYDIKVIVGKTNYNSRKNKNER
jgi:hypothetical protein